MDPDYKASIINHLAARPPSAPGSNALMPRKQVYGYDMRDPYPSESSYFDKNRGVTGMASEDGRVVLNPFSSLAPHERDAVARNEASRLYMRETKPQFDWDATPEQQRSFAGTAYASDPENMRHTILARILSGDPSAGAVTPRQREWADWMKSALESRGNPPRDY